MKHHHVVSVGTLSLLSIASVLSSVGCSSTKAKRAPPTASAVSAPLAADGSVARGGEGGTAGYQATLIESDDPMDRISRVRISTAALQVRPDWVSNPATGGVLGAVGVSSKNDLGTRFQIEDARYGARLEIGRMLETRVQSAGRDLTEQRIRATRSGDDEARANNDSTHSKIGIDRRITDVVLSGSRQRGMWIEPGSQDMYVWVVMDGRILEAVEHSVADDVSIFVALQKIMKEYVPPRPELVVDVENAPEAPALPPQSPAEELEDFLNELRSQPIERDDTRELDEDQSSSITKPREPRLSDEVTGQ